MADETQLLDMIVKRLDRIEGKLDRANEANNGLEVRMSSMWERQETLFVKAQEERSSRIDGDEDLSARIDKHDSRITALEVRPGTSALGWWKIIGTSVLSAGVVTLFSWIFRR